MKHGWVTTRDCAFMRMIDFLFPLLLRAGGTPPNSTPLKKNGDSGNNQKKNSMMLPIQFAASLGGQGRLVEIYLALLVIRSMIVITPSKGLRKRYLSKTRASTTKRRTFAEWLKHVRYFKRTNLNEAQYQSWTNQASDLSTTDVFISNDYSLQDLISIVPDPETPIHVFCTEPRFLSRAVNITTTSTTGNNDAQTESTSRSDQAPVEANTPRTLEDAERTNNDGTNVQRSLLFLQQILWRKKRTRIGTCYAYQHHSAIASVTSFCSTKSCCWTYERTSSYWILDLVVCIWRDEEGGIERLLLVG
jgi:hypothetical protein